MPSAIVPWLAAVIGAGAIALGGCSPEDDAEPEGPSCEGCEWLVRGAPVRAAALDSDGQALFALKLATKELQRFPHEGAGMEEVATGLTSAFSFVVGERVIWLLVANGAADTEEVVVLDKASGAERSRQSLPGVFDLRKGPGGLPVVAVKIGATHRIIALDEDGEEAELYWEDESNTYFRSFSADASGVAWVLSDGFTDELFWLAFGVEVVRLSVREHSLTTTGLVSHAGSLYAMGVGANDQERVLYRLAADDLVELGRLPAKTEWLTPIGEAFVTSRQSSTDLHVFDLEGNELGIQTLPFSPNIAPVADDAWLFVGGESDLVRLALAELHR